MRRTWCVFVEEGARLARRIACSGLTILALFGYKTAPPKVAYFTQCMGQCNSLPKDLYSRIENCTTSKIASLKPVTRIVLVWNLYYVPLFMTD